MGWTISRQLSDHVHLGVCRIVRVGLVACYRTRAMHRDCAWVRGSSHIGQIQVSAANSAFHRSRVISCRNRLSVQSDVALRLRYPQICT